MQETTGALDLLVIGDVPEALAGAFNRVERRPVPAGLAATGSMAITDLVRLATTLPPVFSSVAEAGAIGPVEDLPAEGGRHERVNAGGRRRRRPLVVVTDRDLAAPTCASIFGFGHVEAQVAVVSTARLGAGADGARLAARARNVIAHELGHLRGLAHCGTPGCVMKAARTVDDIDARGEAPCGSCRRHAGRRWRKRLALAAAAVILLAARLAAKSPSTHARGERDRLAPDAEAP